MTGGSSPKTELIENASRGDGHAEPALDAFSPEREADRSTAVYGKSDEIRSTGTGRGLSPVPSGPGAGGPTACLEREGEPSSARPLNLHVQQRHGLELRAPVRGPASIGRMPPSETSSMTFAL